MMYNVNKITIVCPSTYSNRLATYKWKFLLYINMHLEKDIHIRLSSWQLKHSNISTLPCHHKCLEPVRGPSFSMGGGVPKKESECIHNFAKKIQSMWHAISPPPPPLSLNMVHDFVNPPPPLHIMDSHL